ncbi:MAG: hypothetical protein WDO15_15000 [Bacteroidota bacterium]
MVVAEKKAVKKIPEGYTAVTPWIISPDSARLITFLVNAFGAEEITGSRMLSPKARSFTLKCRLMTLLLCCSMRQSRGRRHRHSFACFVDNCEKSYDQAMKAGARGVTKPHDAFIW